jgi:hypothetical protein
MITSGGSRSTPLYADLEVLCNAIAKITSEINGSLQKQVSNIYLMAIDGWPLEGGWNARVADDSSWFDGVREGEGEASAG